MGPCGIGGADPGEQGMEPGRPEVPHRTAHGDDVTAKAAAFFDLDGTLTTGNLWAGLTSWNRIQGRRRWRERWFIAQKIPLAIGHRIGVVADATFRGGWFRATAGLLRGVSESEVDQIVRHTWSHVFEPGLRGVTVERLRSHKAEGLATVLVSGSYDVFLRPFMEHLGIDHVIGTRLAVQNGAYTGELTGEVVMGREKVRRVRELIDQVGSIDLAASYAYGDSDGDLDLLRLVRHPVAVFPSPTLERIAAEAGWQVLRDPP